ASRITHHASRITHHASRITHHASRITHHTSPKRKGREHPRPFHYHSRLRKPYVTRGSSSPLS
ncbi:MAG TPA: hypothetical protein ENJ22_00395, partial [Gammaproteobacteria bacterium]|nr:hypothetical protein [Gammaproteobacteria bacterium]